MKLINFKSVIGCFCCLLLSCESEELANSSNGESLLKLVWRANQGPKFADQIAQDPVIYKNTVLFGYQASDFDHGYMLYDKDTGKVLKDFKKMNSFIYNSFLDGSNYISFTGLRIRKFNLETYRVEEGNVSSPESSMFSIFHKHEGSYYLGTLKWNSDEYCWLKSDINNLTKWIVLTKYKFDSVSQKSKYISAGSSATFNKNEEGDDIMYFGSSLSPLDPLFPIHYYTVNAFNLSKYEYLWRSQKMVVDSNYNGGGTHIVKKISNNLVIASLKGAKIVALDIKDGSVRWEIDNLNQVSLVEVYNEKLTLLESGSGNLYLVDLNSGKVLSKKNIEIGTHDGWALNKGVLYFTNSFGYLYSIDATTHKIKWRFKTPNQGLCDCYFGYNEPIVDPTTDRLYICDRREVFCYQLPE